jgi:hypothetical protein
VHPPPHPTRTHNAGQRSEPNTHHVKGALVRSLREGATMEENGHGQGRRGGLQQQRPRGTHNSPTNRPPRSHMRRRDGDATHEAYAHTCTHRVGGRPHVDVEAVLTEVVGHVGVVVGLEAPGSKHRGVQGRGPRGAGLRGQPPVGAPRVRRVRDALEVPLLGGGLGEGGRGSSVGEKRHPTEMSQTGHTWLRG